MSTHSPIFKKSLVSSPNNFFSSFRFTGCLSNPHSCGKNKSDSRTDGLHCTYQPRGSIVLFDRVYIGPYLLILAPSFTACVSQTRILYLANDLVVFYLVFFIPPAHHRLEFVDVRSSCLSTICFSRTVANQYLISSPPCLYALALA